MSRKTGDKLKDRYLIKKIIGQGGMGSVYLADDTLLEGRKCALKEVEYDQSLNKLLIKEAQSQFLQEATILARLDHPNLPKVSDFFSIGPRDYLVMDYVPGDDLRTIVLNAKHHDNFIETDEILDWTNQLGNALQFLHSQDPPMVHRDIKPSNLKITPNGILKLVDFGLVKILIPDDATITIIQGQGTALYTPLEQYGGDGTHTDIRSDIYSFGATLYQLLTNKQPIGARERFLNPDKLKAPSESNPSIPAQIEKSVLWAMELHPDNRPQSIKEFMDALFGNTNLGNDIVSQKALINRLLSNPQIRSLVWISSGLILISFIISLL